jgi:hypothetical protein
VALAIAAAAFVATLPASAAAHARAVQRSTAYAHHRVVRAKPGEILRDAV